MTSLSSKIACQFKKQLNRVHRVHLRKYMTDQNEAFTFKLRIDETNNEYTVVMDCIQSFEHRFV